MICEENTKTSYNKKKIFFIWLLALFTREWVRCYKYLEFNLLFIYQCFWIANPILA